MKKTVCLQVKLLRYEIWRSCRNINCRYVGDSNLGFNCKFIYFFLLHRIYKHFKILEYTFKGLPGEFQKQASNPTLCRWIKPFILPTLHNCIENVRSSRISEVNKCCSTHVNDKRVCKNSEVSYRLFRCIRIESPSSHTWTTNLTCTNMCPIFVPRYDVVWLVSVFVRSVTATLPASPLVPVSRERDSVKRDDRIVYNDVIEYLCGFAETPQSNIVSWTSASKHLLLLLLRTDAPSYCGRTYAAVCAGTTAHPLAGVVVVALSTVIGHDVNTPPRTRRRFTNKRGRDDLTPVSGSNRVRRSRFEFRSSETVRRAQWPPKDRVLICFRLFRTVASFIRPL